MEKAARFSQEGRLHGRFKVGTLAPFGLCVLVEIAVSAQLAAVGPVQIQCSFRSVAFQCFGRSRGHAASQGSNKPHR